MIASAERPAKGGDRLGCRQSHLFQGPILTGSDRHRGGSLPIVSTGVKLEDRLRGVPESSDVLSHFECTG